MTDETELSLKGDVDDATCDRLAEQAPASLMLYEVTSIPASIAKVKSLRTVKLVSCDELDLADALPKLAKLRALHSLELNTHTYKMVRNIVQPSHVLPDVFDHFEQLRELSVMRGFHPLPRSIGAMKNLESLSIGVNAFDAVPPTIGKLKKLQLLDLRSTPITELPEELCKCEQLVSLVLFNCRKLTELPKSIGRLENLRYLAIQDTAIKALPASAAELTNLRRFFASPKRRLAVPDGFMADGADELEGPPELLAAIEMRPTEVEGEEYVTIDDPERVPTTFGNPSTLNVRLPTYKKPLRQFGALRSLASLELDVLDLDAALKQLKSSPALRQLTINGEHKVLPASIGALRSLTHLTVWAPVKELPVELGQLVNLEELVVGTKVKLPSSIGKLVALQKLHLDRRTRLPAELRTCRALTSLSAGATTNADLATIGSLAALDELFLNGGSTLDETPTIDLAHLARPLAGRKLSLVRIDGPFEELPPEIRHVHIHRLDLESSRIRRLPAEARDWPTLQEVVVRYYHASDVKPSLPTGKWKKTVYQSSTAVYRRS